MPTFGYMKNLKSIISEITRMVTTTMCHITMRKQPIYVKRSTEKRFRK